MGSKPSKQGTNDRRALGPGENGMRINPPTSADRSVWGDAPAACDGCGCALHGSWLDDPAGALCCSDCGSPRCVCAAAA